MRCSRACRARAACGPVRPGRHRGGAGGRCARLGREHPRVRPRPRARDRGLLQRLRRPRRDAARAPASEIDFHSRSPTRADKDWSYLGIGDERALRRGRRRLGRGRRRGRRRAGRARARGAAARARPAPTAADFSRWEAHADPRPLVADPLRAARERSRRARRAVPRPLRRRRDDDQHEGRDCARTRATSRSGIAASGLLGAGGEPFGEADLARTTTASSAPRRARAQRLAAERRRHRRARLRGARREPRVGALLHRRELHALRLLPAGLPDERRQVDAEHLHPRRLGARHARAARRLRRSSAS